MARRILGPFNRAEGCLEIKLDIEEGEVTSALVVSPMYRGFEKILQGKDPCDALVYVPRICGICSVSQSVAASRALADLQGITPPPNGQLSHNLLLATENVIDHLTHFYLFFMPDFARPVYKEHPWFERAEKRFKAIKGDAAKQMLPARAAFLHIMGIMAGKWPHSLAIQPGGTTKALEINEKLRILSLLANFRHFLETVLFGDRLENIAAISSMEELENWVSQKGSEDSDFCRYIEIAGKTGLVNLGRCRQDSFLSYGAYKSDNDPVFAAGAIKKMQKHDFLSQKITEDLSHSWMSQSNGAKHPFDGMTIPDYGADNGYSWCKAPRLDGEVFELGALARQSVDGHPLVRDMVRQNGANVFSRTIARLLEIALTIPLMEQWVGELQPGERFCITEKMPDEGQGVGLVEAARGGLGHWIKVKNNYILNYQIIAPTSWNFSPRDEAGTPGALEQALVGTKVDESDEEPILVQHVVRSFDPCMFCTVH
ncbi:MAG: nickel-dependent hydrogenase large subunit [bacterium]|nr:nickel-dependent hydrogenase large subunit [bacterium]